MQRRSPGRAWSMSSARAGRSKRFPEMMSVKTATAQRRQEFGIRTALGATPAAITRLALGRGVVLTTLGLALGAVAAAGAGRLATGFLVGVRPGDPVVFAVVGCLLAATALAACLVPSRRAARADPLATLRAD